MPISIRDRKLLWSRAGNRCAFPGCLQELAPQLEDGSDVVVGDEAHILPASSNGPRGVECRDGVTIDSYANRILLCPTHHRFVDSESTLFPADALRGMKADHERRMREAQFRGQEGPLGLGVRLYGDYPTTNVHIYGPPATRTRGGRWIGSGLHFIQSAASGQTVELFNSSEFDPDVEFWMSAGVLHIVQSTYLYDDGEFVPILKHEFDTRQFPATHRTVQLLLPPPGFKASLRDIVTELQGLHSPDSHERTTELLGTLFKIGLTKPEAVIEVFPRIADVCFPGGEASLGRLMQRELEQIATHRELSGNDDG